MVGLQLRMCTGFCVRWYIAEMTDKCQLLLMKDGDIVAMIKLWEC